MNNSLSVAAGNKKRVAVVGSGISGAAAAWFLRHTHDVTLYEAEARAGGHTCTVDVDYDGTQIPVDVGFIVFNERNYPNLCALFEHLAVKSELTNMSFAVSLDGGKREWSGQSLLTVFAQKRNVFSFAFLNMLKDVLRFNKSALADRDSGFMHQMSIGQYVQKRRFGQRFVQDYLIPMGAAIWSTPETKMMDFPAASLVNFFENHRLLEVAPPVWRTVSGGSRNYHNRLMEDLGHRVRLGTPVTKIERPASGGVVVHHGKNAPSHYDDIIIATHTDQALALLSDASPMETALLGDIAYRPNRVVLHRDARFMPKRKAAWAAWNTLRSSGAGEDADISLTYWMNRLQNIDEAYPLFVTLNPAFEPAKGTIFGEWRFDHPQFDGAAFDAQARLIELNGQRNTYFAGAWMGYGFHEDGLKSAITAARALGGTVPWMQNNQAVASDSTLSISDAAA